MAIILDGKKVSEEIKEKLRKEVLKFTKKPGLAIIQVGNRPESNAYIARKKKFGEDIGAKVLHIVVPEKVSQRKLLSEIEKLNKDKTIHGIIVQMPIPEHLDKHEVLESIAPEKDVDGLQSHNAAFIYEYAFGGQDSKNIGQGFFPATAKGVITLLKHYKIPIHGQNAIVIGRSLLVGKPTAMLLMRENATVTIAHKYTKNLDELVRQNDIVVVAVGKAGLIGKKALKKDQVVVDVGTNAVLGPKTLEEIGKRKLVGDVIFDEAVKIVKAISPVPGGVGPMTVASLFENLLEAYGRK